MDCLAQGLVRWFDIFCLGLMLGGITVVAARALERWSEARLERNKLELDVTLGKALLQMREALEKPISKGGGDAPHA